MALGLTACSQDTLISDQEMLDHFHQYRQAFDALIATTVDYDDNWEIRPDVIALSELTGIERVIEGYGETWEDPYSTRLPAEIRELLRFFPDPWIRAGHNLKIYNQTEFLIIKMQDADKYYRIQPSNGGLNWKDYIYFHDEREVKNQKIYWRCDEGKKCAEKDTYVVLNSLDRLKNLGFLNALGIDFSPSIYKWEERQCVVRKIDAHWFLRRCREL